MTGRLFKQLNHSETCLKGPPLGPKLLAVLDR